MSQFAVSMGIESRVRIKLFRNLSQVITIFIYADALFGTEQPGQSSQAHRYHGILESSSNRNQEDGACGFSGVRGPWEKRLQRSRKNGIDVPWTISSRALVLFCIPNASRSEFGNFDFQLRLLSD